MFYHLPMVITLTVEGTQQVVSALDAIRSKLDTEVGRVLRETAENIVNNAQSKARVDTGFMRDHIRVSRSSDTEAEVESAAGYSGFQEYGTRYMSAHPFFEPAIREEIQKVQQRMRDAIGFR